MNKLFQRSLLAVCLLGMITLCGCTSFKGYEENAKGISYMEEGKYAEAESAFAQAVYENSNCAEFYVNQAYAQLQLGNGEAAKVTAMKALTQEDADAFTYRCAGIVCFKNGEYDLAAVYMENALQRLTEKDGNELKRDCTCYLAESKEKLGDMSGAAARYTELIAMNDKDAENYYLRGKCYSEIGDMQSAIADFEVVKELAPKKMSYYVDIYMTLLEHDRTADGSAYLEKAAEQNPKTLEERKNHGAVQYLLGKYEEAISELNEISEEEKDANTWIYLGLSSQELGETDQASAFFEKALANTDHPAQVYYQLGLLELKLGHYEQALRDLQNGLAVNDPEMQQKLQYAEAAATEYTCAYREALNKFLLYRDTYGTTPELEHEIAWLQTR